MLVLQSREGGRIIVSKPGKARSFSVEGAMTPRHGCRYPPSFYAANACGLRRQWSNPKEAVAQILLRPRTLPPPSSADYKQCSCSLSPAHGVFQHGTPGASAITGWRQMMTAKRKAVRGGTQNSLSVRGCGADAFLSAAMTPRYAWQVRTCRETGGSIAQAIRHVRLVFTVARRRQPCRHCIVCAVAPA